MAKLIPKSLQQMVSALEDHLHLLHLTLSQLATGDAAHLRALAGQLRALVCTSSGLPGLLWRLRGELDVSDSVLIRYPGKINTAHPLAHKLYFSEFFATCLSNGPRALPEQPWPLRDHICHHEAVFIDRVSMTHEVLISRLANEVGTAHEADGISKDLAKLSAIRIGDVQPYFSILATDAQLVLEVGERVVQAATQQGYLRRRPSAAPAKIESLLNVRFGSSLDVPKAQRHSNEGTIFFVLPIGDLPSSGRLVSPRLYPPFTSGAVTIQAEITRRRRLRISSTGLPLPCFGFDTAIPDPTSDTLAVGISWKGHDVYGYVAGKQIAGPPCTEGSEVASP